MIISHKHKFIFIHCRKAAGSSVMISLQRYLGHRDVQTAALSDALALGIKPNLGSYIRLLHPWGAYGFAQQFLKSRSFSKGFNMGVKGSYRPLTKNTGHFTATDIVKNWPTEWNNYHKLCVVRNPYEKTVSDYLWRTRNLEQRPDFEYYISAIYQGDDLGGLVPPLHDNWQFYSINDEIAVDSIVRFEDIKTGLERALKNTSLQWDGWLPHAKKSPRNKTCFGYTDYHNQSTLRMVSEIYKKEIGYFGYTPSN